MNVIILSREIPPVGGGAGAVAIEHARGLAQRGHRVHLLTTTLPPGQRRTTEWHDDLGDMVLHEVDVARRSLHTTTYPEMLRFVLRAVPIIRRIVRTESVDAVHAHAVLPDALPFHVIPRSIRSTVTAHGSDVPGFNRERFRLAHVLLRPLWMATSRRADVICAPSEYLVGLLRRHRPSDPIVRFPHGVVLRHPLDLSLRQRRTIVVAARLDPRKRIHLLLEALASVPPGITCHVLGEGPERGRLEDLAARLGGRHDVRFHGWVHNQSPEWCRIFAESSISISMSTVENAPVSILEAQLAEHVVVASDIPGHRSVLHPGGRFIEPTSVALAEELQRILDSTDEALLEERLEGRDFVERNFSWATVLDAYEDLHGLRAGDR